MALKIAVTGATGFAGQHVMRTLLAGGHQVRALARNPQRLAGVGRVEVVAGDLHQPESLGQLVDSVDAVVHLAGAIAARSRAEFHATNVEGTKSLAAAAAAAGVRRIVHVSSLAAREPQLSAYGESKRTAEAVFAGNPGAVIIRPPAIYGPGDRGTLPLIRQLLNPVALIPSHVAARFSLIYVQDLADIIATLAGDERTGIHEVHDGKAGGYGWHDLVALARVQEGVPRRLTYLPKLLPLAVAYAVTPLQLVSTSLLMITPGKIRELYHGDWTCDGGLTASRPTSFADGFACTVAWYRKEEWLPPRRNADKSRTSTKYGESAE